MKILYVFFREELIDPVSAKFVDKDGVEYELVNGLDVHRYTFQGTPIVVTMPPPVRKEKHNNSKDQVRSSPPVRYEGMGSYATTPVQINTSEPRGAISWFETPRMGPTRSFHVANKFSGFPKGEGVPKFEDNSRRVRPSQFQKWVRKYDGSGDPYDHLASFKHVLRAEQVTDFHTQYEGFGLMLEGKALSWFQTLEPTQYEQLEQVEEGFIMAFSKMGIKHNTVAQIYKFKQKPHETVKDCASRLRQYVTRCPAREIPSQKRLVSLFLEGLVNKTLHMSIYGKKHGTLNECIQDAIDLDDNCDLFSIRLCTHRGLNILVHGQRRRNGQTQLILQRQSLMK